jgi:serine/threonine protein phosphatase PrpC
MLTEMDDATVTRDFAGLSHRGHGRPRNEDCFFLAAKEGLALVADGVGGQGDGAWASRRALELFVPELAARAVPDQQKAITETLAAVHGQMFEETRAKRDAPSGTTIAGVWAPQGSRGPAVLFNVGDSSVFHFSSGKLTKLSHDHSLYQLWLDGGQVGREPAKRMIMQALGISERVLPFVAPLTLAAGDAVLICTDGLSGVISPDRMAQVLAGMKNARAACDALLRQALACMANDNVTVSVCCF